MDNSTYYGSESMKTITYLEFGEIDIENCEKKIWNFQLHQKAYDWLMLGRYANDLQSAVTMQKLLQEASMQDVINLYNKEVHHGDEASLNLSKLIALSVTSSQPVLEKSSFYELGQTIFGCIEGMEFYYDLLNKISLEHKTPDLKSVAWYGVDISEMFNELSVTFHREYTVHTMVKESSLPDKMDVFFSKGITLLYAVRSVQDLFNTINRGRLAIFDYSFSLDEVEDTTIGSGKTVRYLNIDDFLGELDKREEVMYVKRCNSKYLAETNRVWLDCVYGTEALCKEYMELDIKLREGLSQELSGLADSERFLNDDLSPEWVGVVEFLQTLKR